MLGSFNPVSFLWPSSPDEVVKLLLKEKDRARIIAGGTTIYEMANRGLLSDVGTLIDISRLGLNHVVRDVGSKTLFIGASVTFTQMLENVPLRESRSLGAILDALILVKPVQIRNAATIAGSVCSGLPFFDLPVALTAVDTRVVGYGPGGERKVDLKDFIGGLFMVELKEGEFVKGFEIPMTENSGSSFEKFCLTGDDWAIVNCATSLTLDDKQVIRECRIVIGGGVRSISRPEEAGRALEGTTPSREKLEAAVTSAIKSVEFVNDTRGSEAYRKRVAAYLLKSAFEKSLRRASNSARDR